MLPLPLAYLGCGYLLFAFGASPREALQAALYLPDVCQRQLKVDDVNVRQRVHLARHVYHVVILKTAHHLHVNRALSV